MAWLSILGGFGMNSGGKELVPMVEKDNKP